MHVRHGFVLKHIELGLYLDKKMEGLTASLFGAITFKSEAEAWHMLTDSHYKPEYPERYKIVKTIERRMEWEGEEDEREHENIRKSS